MRLLYQLLLWLAVVPATVFLAVRGRRQGDAPGRWVERFGWVPRPAAPIAVWVHAASLGEVIAARPLLDDLVARYGAGGLWVTTMTSTGSQAVRQHWGEAIGHSYMPFDLERPLRRFLQRVQPERCVILETEIWPNCYEQLKRRGIPLMLANARLSPRSAAGYRRLGRTIAGVLRRVGIVAAQSEADAERFRALGAPRVALAGNIKFDLTPPEKAVARGWQWRQLLGERPVWIAASTHDGEESAVLAAHRELLRWYPDALLVLVPRHPQRFDAVARGLDREGWPYVRRSASADGPRLDASHSILLGDSTGEMFSYLAMADAAFVGGSLVEIGGHNILEPAALGLPVLFGPHMFHFADARRLLLAAGGAQEVASAQDLAVAVAAYFARPERRDDVGRAAARAVAANRGAVARHLELLDELRPGRPAEAAGH